MPPLHGGLQACPEGAGGPLLDLHMVDGTTHIKNAGLAINVPTCRATAFLIAPPPSLVLFKWGGEALIPFII